MTFPRRRLYVARNTKPSVIVYLGCQEGRQKRRKGSGQGPQEERGRWRQGQEEEVVQGKDPRQVEQPGSLRSGHIRQIGEGGTYIQAHHTFPSSVEE